MKNQIEDVRNDEDSTPNRNDMRNIADIAELSDIRLGGGV